MCDTACSVPAWIPIPVINCLTLDENHARILFLWEYVQQSFNTWVRSGARLRFNLAQVCPTRKKSSIVPIFKCCILPCQALASFIFFSSLHASGVTGFDLDQWGSELVDLMMVSCLMSAWGMLLAFEAVLIWDSHQQTAPHSNSSPSDL